MIHAKCGATNPILLAKSSGCGWHGHQACEGGLAGSFAWGARKPVVDTAKVCSSSCDHVLQVSFCEPDTAGPAQVHDADAE